MSSGGITTAQVKKRINRLNDIGMGLEMHRDYRTPKALKPHRIDTLHLSLILRGQVRHQIGETFYDQKQGALGVIPFGERHKIHTGDQSADVLNIFLDPDEHVMPAIPEALTPYLYRLIPLQTRSIHREEVIRHLQIAELSTVRDLCEIILREQVERSGSFREMIYQCFGLLFIEFARNVERHGVDIVRNERSPSAWLEDLLQSIEKFPEQDYPLEEVAKKYGMNPSYISRKFHELTGARLSDHLLQARIRKAMTLLRTGKQKILAVALECGFQDQSYFNRKFKQVTGPLALKISQSPHLWRLI